jgi:glycosyltransferase involved in cell wall biosynthesis
MHIAFLLTQSLESPSGLGRYWPIARELAQLGYQVTILALHPDYKNLLRRQFDRDGVRICYVGQMHVRKSGSHKTYFSPARLLLVTALATWWLSIAALRTPADAYHLGKPHPMNGVAGLIASRLRRKPLYLDCDDYEAASNRFGGGWQRRIVAFFGDCLPRCAVGVTVNTRFMEQRLRTLGVLEDRIVYVPNGVERARFANTVEAAETAARLRQELDLVNCPVILYIGSLSLVSHAVDLLMEAFVWVRQVLPDAILVLVGGGEDYDTVMTMVSQMSLGNYVRIVGRVPVEDAPYYYALGDVTVDPVRNDAASTARSPLKIVESMVLGVPIVTGDVGDRRALLEGGELGVLVLPGDSRALANGLLTVLRDARARAHMSQAALARREQWYWDQLVHDFVRVYDKTA